MVNYDAHLDYCHSYTFLWHNTPFISSAFIFIMRGKEGDRNYELLSLAHEMTFHIFFPKVTVKNETRNGFFHMKEFFDKIPAQSEQNLRIVIIKASITPINQVSES
jgi:hypothetical protein